MAPVPTLSLPRAVDWSPTGDALRILDQRRLPAERVERDLRTVDEVCDAIRTLAVRGAPAIGVAGAIGLAVVVTPHARLAPAAFDRVLAESAGRIRAARPTAVNLPWAVDRLLASDARERAAGASPRARVLALRAEASRVLDEDRAMCRRIGDHAVALIDALRAEGRPDAAGGRPVHALTHCNAGALATAGIGTALAPLYVLAERGRTPRVWADETRPLLQGSRLTAWELGEAGIPVTVIADNMAAALLRAEPVDVVLVGADRIAANGDAANKIGTYGLALAARAHGVPFVVLAPTSTVDPATATGAGIPIEERGAEELRAVGDTATAPPAAAVWNPAFDVTPAGLITAIVTDRGVFRPPYDFAARAEPALVDG